MFKKKKIIVEAETVVMNPDCKSSHKPEDANIIYDNFSRRVWEWECSCRHLVTTASRPEKTNARKGVARGADTSEFFKGLFRNEF